MNQLQLENSTLGCLMLDGSAWDRAGYQLKLTDFTFQENSIIFTAIKEIAGIGDVAPDLIAVCNKLEQTKRLTQAVAEHAQRISGTTWSAAQVVAYVEMLKDLSLTREIKNTAGRMANLTGPGKEQIVQVQGLLTQLEEKDSREPAQVGECLEPWIDVMQKRAEADGSLIGLGTGWSAVDHRLSGMRPGDFIIIAGRPAMGKTAAALNILTHNSRQGSPALFFSLEMERETLLDRMVSSMSGVPFPLIRSGRLDDEHWPMITKATGEISKLPLFIDDQPALTIQEIHARSRQIKRRHGLDLVVIDYLQLIETEGKHYNRESHVSEVSRYIKRMAKDVNVPVIVIAQPNRKCEERPDKRPLMGDLRESGQIENDADSIAFLYRDEVYNPGTQFKGFCELIWRKARNSQPGTDWLSFNGRTQTFKQLDPSELPKLKTPQATRGPYHGSD